MSEDKLTKRILEDSAVILVAIIAINLTMFTQLIPFEVGVFAFLIGVGLAGIGCFDIAFAVRNKNLHRHLLSDQKGIVYVWFVIAITVAFLAMVWWVLALPLWMIIQAMEGIAAYPPEAVGAVNLVKNVITYFLVFVVLGCIVFGLVSSFRREDIQTPLG